MYRSHNQSTPFLVTEVVSPKQPCTFAVPVSAKKHTMLPFAPPIPPPPAAEAEEEAEEDIEVDLGLQQALIHSIAPSPAKMHTKGNALHDISNWRLPTPNKKLGPGGGVSPLQALTSTKGDAQTSFGDVSLVMLLTGTAVLYTNPLYSQRNFY